LLNLKVLIVNSYTSGKDSVFVLEQVESCIKQGVEFDFLKIKQRGLKGYILAYIRLIRAIISVRYDVIHAHYGLCGLIAVIQPFVPVVVTFHGCDVNSKRTNYISKIVYRLSRFAIVVESEMIKKLGAQNKVEVIPCGVDLDIFQPMDKSEARKELEISDIQKTVLFASSFSIAVKNAELAKRVCSNIDNVVLIELANKSRSEVNLLLNSCDLLLLTSIREGSPMIIKEALATNCPIVSVNVGDVSERTSGVKNVIVCSPNETDLTRAINISLMDNNRTDGRTRIINDRLDVHSVAKRICNIYEQCAGL